MGVIADALRRELTQPDYSEGYAESFLDSFIATQIKVLREERQLTQAKLAERIKTTQTVISRIENVNYSGWNIGTLKKLARAFELRLKVSFEEFGTLPREVESFSRKTLKRLPRSMDPRLDHEKGLDDADLRKLSERYRPRTEDSQESSLRLVPNPLGGATSKASPNTQAENVPKKGAASEVAGNGQDGTGQNHTRTFNTAI